MSVISQLEKKENSRFDLIPELRNQPPLFLELRGSGMPRDSGCSVFDGWVKRLWEHFFCSSCCWVSKEGITSQLVTWSWTTASQNFICFHLSSNDAPLFFPSKLCSRRMSYTQASSRLFRLPPTTPPSHSPVPSHHSCPHMCPPPELPPPLSPLVPTLTPFLPFQRIMWSHRLSSTWPLTHQASLCLTLMAMRFSTWIWKRRRQSGGLKNLDNLPALRLRVHWPI